MIKTNRVDSTEYTMTDEYEVIVRAARAVPPSVMSAVLFGGDRLACVDFAVIAHAKGQLVGLTTFASHIPTLVGIWVHPEYRVKRESERIAQTMLFIVTEWAKSYGLFPMRVDAITMLGKKFFANRSPGLLDVHTCTIPFALPESGESPEEFTV